MASKNTRALRRRAVWAVPGAAVVAVGVIAVVPSASADTHPSLPTRTAAQLLASVQTSSTQALSGTVSETARLGFPSLPGAGDSASLSWQSLVQGSHELRVWVDGPEKQRIAVTGTLAESDVVHNGTDLWTYSSADRTATHITRGDDMTQEPTDPRAQAAESMTPQGLAEQALAAIDPTTTVAVESTASVAGRSAYTLSLAPRQTGSTVGRVLIAVDAETSVPLQVQVFGTAGDEPVLEAGFTDVSFTIPAASTFAFTPPAGTKITQHTATAKPSDAMDHSSTDHSAVDHSAIKHSAREYSATGAPTVLGTGWASVLAFPAGSATALMSGATPGAAAGSRHADPATTDLLGRLTTTLPGGAKLLSTTLVNILMTPDGRVFIGAVTPAVLESAAGVQA